VTPSTEIRGNPGVEDLVEVRVLQGSGGSLMATRIRREDSSGRGDAGDDHGGGNGSSGGPGDDPAGDDRGHGGSGSRGGSGHGDDD
jgi:hypothetical protein